MSRFSKFLLLFVALVVPGVIYFFLKTFGHNEFEVPALYQKGPLPIIAGCDGNEYTAPYLIQDSVMRRLGWQSGAAVFLLMDKTASGEIVGGLHDEFKEAGFSKIHVADTMMTAARCALLLQPPAQVALVDEYGFIRGQYEVNDRDEADRLILELKILLKQY